MNTAEALTHAVANLNRWQSAMTDLSIAIRNEHAGAWDADRCTSEAFALLYDDDRDDSVNTTPCVRAVTRGLPS